MNLTCPYCGTDVEVEFSVLLNGDETTTIVCEDRRGCGASWSMYGDLDTPGRAS